MNKKNSTASLELIIDLKKQLANKNNLIAGMIAKQESLVADMTTANKDNLIADVIANKNNLIAKQESLIASMTVNIQNLHEQVQFLLALKYGKSSEKKRPVETNERQLYFFDEIEFVCRTDPPVEPVQDQAENDQTIIVPEHNRKKRGRKSIDPALPRKEIFIDIPEEKKVCPCGCSLNRIGEEISEKLEIIPQKICVNRYVRPKYACPKCEGTEDEISTVKIAPMPKMLIKQGIVTSSLLAYILINKFCDSLPFYRQTVIFRRIGVDIPRATMSSWAIQAADKCMPFMEILYQHLRTSSIINIDETPLQVLREKNKLNTSKSFMWVARGTHKERKVVLFRYSPTRSATAAADMVGPFFRGYLQSDGYSGYNALGQREGITHVGCLVHVRRKFIEIARTTKNVPGIASTIIDLIQKVYHHENKFRTDAEKELDKEAYILTKREEKIRPFLNRIKDILIKANAPPKSLLGNAIRYALGQWNRIEAYLGNPYLTPDNNVVENAIRPFAIGRKNWLFSGSPRGAQASAALYSIIETAKANNINPYTYLYYLFEKLPYAQTPAELESLMPWNVRIPSIISE